MFQEQGSSTGIKDSYRQWFCFIGFPQSITFIYLQNSTSLVSNASLVLLELLFEVSSLLIIQIRFAVIQLAFKYYFTRHSRRQQEMQLRSSPENISSQNLLSPQESSNLHVTEEIFTLVSINNLKDVESSALIDFSLILGSIIHSYLSGSLAVSNLQYRGGMTNLFIF